MEIKNQVLAIKSKTQNISKLEKYIMEKMIVLSMNGNDGHTEDLEVECQLYDTETTEDLLCSSIHFEFDKKTQMEEFVSKLSDGEYHLKEAIGLYSNYEGSTSIEMLNFIVSNNELKKASA